MTFVHSTVSESQSFVFMFCNAEKAPLYYLSFVFSVDSVFRFVSFRFFSYLLSFHSIGYANFGFFELYESDVSTAKNDVIDLIMLKVKRITTCTFQ